MAIYDNRVHDFRARVREDEDRFEFHFLSAPDDSPVDMPFFPRPPCRAGGLETETERLCRKYGITSFLGRHR